MSKKHQVHNLIILDESGSMQSIKNSIVQGFNELVQTIKGIQEQFPEQEHYISFVSFNGLGQKLLHFMDPVSKLEEIDADMYQPNSMTPLYDAMGFAIGKLRMAMEGKQDYNVLVTILTDGAENASREYAGQDIKAMVEELTAQNWTFTYIGTDHDVQDVCDSLSISNTLTFDKNEAGISNMFFFEKRARISYSKKISVNEDVSDSFFDLDESWAKGSEEN